MLELEGFILLGGASSRMGTDKARLDIGGKQFVARIASALASVSTSISIVGARASEEDWQFPNFPDVYPNWGALGGIHGALASCQSEWAAIVACDLPFVTGELFVKLAGLRDSVDAIVPVQEDGRLQPLCAMYRRTSCLPVAEDLIKSGERRPRKLFVQLRTRFVQSSELSALSGAQLFFMNINTREDYEQAMRAVMSDE